MEEKEKSEIAKKEETILEFWKENRIFEKSLTKPSPKGEFVFFEGPPTANAKPALHHLVARAFKDVIPRYKTMQGFHVRRKAGWDTHGLPVELQVEKKLGLKSKKEIETFGITEFNKECRESVFEHIKEWEEFTDRIGYWVDKKNAYFTFDSSYIESVWHILERVNERGLLYKDYKVLPWCPRCGTALSSHELAQGYEEVKDPAVFVKFLAKGESAVGGKEVPTYFVAWTTTPWTLPGNVALAVHPDVTYVYALREGERYVFAKARLEAMGEGFEIEKEIQGSELVGLAYEPLYPYTQSLANEAEKAKLGNAYKIYAADFVTTTDGTGIVHTAVMYGADDFTLGNSVGLPKVHVINEEGRFLPGVTEFAGRFVKEKNEAGKPTLDVDIIDDLKKRNLFLKQENYKHSYPHCWRCKTPLIYFARDSWYIAMSKLRDELLAENQKINWEPAHTKEGRFGEWLREIKDWAISRERYWGTPMPIWSCNLCSKKEVVGSVDVLRQRVSKGNRFLVMRHGGTHGNALGLISYVNQESDTLSEMGTEGVLASAEKLAGEKIDIIVASPFTRTRQTAELVATRIGIPIDDIIYRSELREMNVGDFEGKTWEEYHALFPKTAENFVQALPNGESYMDVRHRLMQVLSDLEELYKGKTILVVTHGGPAWLVSGGVQGLDAERTLELIRDKSGYHYLQNAEYTEVSYSHFPHNENYELDLHRPYIDQVTFPCACGGIMTRTKEVMDVWLDSGAMPFAQDHYPFQNKEWIDGEGYPADFISEAIDQTRGWFYTLLAIGVLMEKGTPYKNVICLGHILDTEGKKMSKSVGNVVDPWLMMDKYGVDALRLWMYSVNQPGESKNFDEKNVEELSKKVFTILRNVIAFYELQSDHDRGFDARQSPHVLDRWILTLFDQTRSTMSSGLDTYSLLESSRAIRDFIQELSQWYVRRSRDRFKENNEDSAYAHATLRFILRELSKLMAPFTPFFAEEVFQKVRALNDNESVHLEEWPVGEESSVADSQLLASMQETREVVSKALELRSKANIKVRQPLASLQLQTTNNKLQTEFLELICDEVNVKEVVLGEEFLLDTEITPELAREGEYRDLVRLVQDLRKEKGLKPGELVTVSLPEKYKEILVGFESEFQKTVSANSILFGNGEISVS